MWPRKRPICSPQSAFRQSAICCPESALDKPPHLSYCHMTVGYAVPVTFQVGEARLPAAGGPGEGRGGVRCRAGGGLAAWHPAARGGTAGQPEHGGEGLRGARGAGRHRDECGKGLFRPAEQLSVEERRPAEDAGRDPGRCGGARASRADREERVPAAGGRAVRHTRKPAVACREFLMPMSEQTPAIEVTNLVRRYGRTDAVDGLSLRLPAGRSYGFFGRNGAGKTTPIKCLLNLLRPT